MFQNTNQNIGSIREGATKQVEFPYSEIGSITQTSASCGCTGVEVKPSGVGSGLLVASYTGKPVPPHLWGQGSYEQCLNITVTFTPLSEPTRSITELLTFTVRVVKPQ